MSDAAPPSRNLLKRALRPAVSVVDKVIERRGAIVFPRKTEVNESLTKVYGDLLEATTDVRRWLADDLDANTETAALLGRSLARLSDAVERLGDQVAGLGERLDRIEAAVAGAPVDARSTPE
jgi:hypothetical protein